MKSLQVQKGYIYLPSLCLPCKAAVKKLKFHAPSVTNVMVNKSEAGYDEKDSLMLFGNGWIPASNYALLRPERL